MFAAITMSDGCSVTGIGFKGFDAAFDITDTSDVRISNVRVEGRVAVKGSRAKRPLMVDITHSHNTPQTNLALAIRSAIYGNV